MYIDIDVLIQILQRLNITADCRTLSWHTARSTLPYPWDQTCIFSAPTAWQNLLACETLPVCCQLSCQDSLICNGSDLRADVCQAVTPWGQVCCVPPTTIEVYIRLAHKKQGHIETTVTYILSVMENSIISRNDMAATSGICCMWCAAWLCGDWQRGTLACWNPAAFFYCIACLVTRVTSAVSNPQYKPCETAGLSSIHIQAKQSAS